MNQEATNSSLINDLPFTQLAQSDSEGSAAKGAARCQLAPALAAAAAWPSRPRQRRT